jgi:hypothetical protein
MTGAYDSRADTLAHISRVRDHLGAFVRHLLVRAEVHDQSKLSEPEKPAFDRETPKLKTLVFGSDDYKASLAALGPALQHHYSANSHHPEHYEDGIAGMDLMDLVEMFCDWVAAAERTAGSGKPNLDVSVERFKIEPQLASILRNTLERF